MARKFLILLVVFAVLVAGFYGYRGIRNARIARRAAELGQVLEEEIREWEARDRSRPPLFEPAVEGTAWDHYREAWRLHEELDDKFFELEDWSEMSEVSYQWNDFSDPLPSGTERWLEYYEPVLLAVRKGTSSRRSGVACDLRRGAITEDRDEESGPVHGYACAFGLKDLLKIRAAASLESGGPAEAVSWLLVSARLSEDLILCGGVLDCAVGRAGAGVVRMDLARLVGGGLLPEDQAERLAALSRPPAPGWTTLDAQFLTAQVDLMRIAQGHVGWLRNPFRKSAWYEEILFSFAEPGRGEALEAWLRLREEYPVWKRTWPGEDQATVRKARDGIAQTMAGSSKAWQLFAGSFQQAFQLTLNTQTDAEETHEMLQLNVALFRYRQKEGKDPLTIEEIRPSGVREMTSLGIWDWRESEHAPHRWIERGTLADEEKRNAVFAGEAEEFMEVLEDSDLLK